ncbi:MAG: DUF2339 domain-containing protein [Rhodothermia bacterium]|nr:DUF2339 domain-containing protein [Rhodothermia bacterium]
MNTDPDTPDNDIQRRLAELESRVVDLETELASLRSGAPTPPDAPVPDLDTDSDVQPPVVTEAPAERVVPPVMGPGADRAAKPPKKQRREERPDWSRDRLDSFRSALRSEDIISKLGIGLLLIGLALMFKFGIDRGWITPPFRIVIGFAFGAILMLGGFKVQKQRRRFSRVLLGGAVATFYVTIFSAYQLYSLFSYEVAFGLMVAVTTVSFALAVRQDDVVLAIIATAGGLGTPFILFTGAPGILWLILYTCLICASAAAIYMLRGWRWLLLVVVAGGWAVLTHVWLQIQDIGYLPTADKVVYQLGVVFCLGLFGILPAVRELLVGRDPDRWPVPDLAIKLGLLVDRPGLWLTVVSPLIALVLSRGVWDVTPVVWGAIEIVFATGYWAVYLFKRPADDGAVISGFGIAAALLLAIAWFDLFTDDSLTLLALALEAGAILVVTRVQDDAPLRLLGHMLFAIAALWVGVRLSTVPEDPSVFRLEVLAHLSVIAGLVAAATATGANGAKSVYRVAAMLLLALAWSSLFASGSVRLIALCVQAAAVMIWVDNVEDRWLRYTAHFLFVALAMALLQRATEMPAVMPPLVNGPSLADLSVIVIAAGISAAVRDRPTALAYRFGAYVAFLLWFWRDLVPLEDGHAYVSIAWGAIAISMIVVGWRSDRDLVRQTGLATLAVVVAKLFAIDLSELDPVWRIILFIGFGGLLLVTSYLFPAIWRGPAEASHEEPSQSAASDDHP